jgi:hypothetical protein
VGIGNHPQGLQPFGLYFHLVQRQVFSWPTNKKHWVKSKGKLTNIVCHNYVLNPKNRRMNVQATRMIVKKKSLPLHQGLGPLLHRVSTLVYLLNSRAEFQPLHH